MKGIIVKKGESFFTFFDIREKKFKTIGNSLPETKDKKYNVGDLIAFFTVFDEIIISDHLKKKEKTLRGI